MSTIPPREPRDPFGWPSGARDSKHEPNRSKLVGDLGMQKQDSLRPIKVGRPEPRPRRGSEERDAWAVGQFEEGIIAGHINVGPEQPLTIVEGEVAAPGAAELPRDEQAVSIIIELNVAYPGGMSAVRQAFFDLFEEVIDRCVLLYDLSGEPPEPGIPAGLRRISPRLYQCAITRSELNNLLRVDGQNEAEENGSATIFKAWPDYSLEAQIDRSAPTVKADAARRSYAASGKKIVWAVMDTGIDALHPHFRDLPLANAEEIEASLHRPGVKTGRSATFGLHRDFTYLVDPSRPHIPAPLSDPSGHGTHVAGIISGRCPVAAPHLATSFERPEGDASRFVMREVGEAPLVGMAPDCALVSLKVMQPGDDGNDHTSASALIAAIDYIQNQVNVGRGPLQIHGVNISLGCKWMANVYAAGQSPLCQALNQLVASGVIVVVSAGNSGSTSDGQNQMAVMGSITEPGHAADVITVGSTHRDSPHTFGITYTSSKGPTLDGRRKPDVVAPGEWISSAATGNLRSYYGLDPASLAGKPDLEHTYAEQSGTSMAAPHVSGVIAAFLSARPEFIGRPREVKQLLCESATDLGREAYAQGHGLVDLMRMLSDS